MTSKGHRLIVGVTIALSVAITVGGACPAWAGPALHHSVEYSKATSTKECGQQAVSVLARLRREGRFSDHKALVASTKNSTASINCLFVGRSDQRANQWIFYIVVAGDDGPEVRDLLELLRKRVNAIERID